MNLVVATIPEDPVELAGWLERRLVGLELDGLVAELTAIHKPAGSGLSVRELLGPKLDQVRSSGLSCLSRDQLRHLLTRPALLLDLQEEILSKGGLYWDQIAHTLPAVYLKVERGRRRLPDAAGMRPTVRPAESGASTPWYRQTWLACLATAAGVLLCVGVWMLNRPAATTVTAWGWERPCAIKDDATASAYLDNLADGAEEWFKKRPDDDQALAQRIGEMRQGCSRLIRSPHRPLSAKDKEWLVERCKAWAKDFDKALAALEDGKPVEDVRGMVDNTVERLTKALRDRARQAT
jgi:hypothetical protein